MTPAVLEPPGALVELHVPGDWRDLVLDDEQMLRRQIYETFPPEVRESLHQGLMQWRTRPGLLSHGVVEIHEAGRDATWHVLTSVVPVPQHADVDSAVVLSRLLDSGSWDAYVEAFDTPQGRAVGLLEEQAPLLPDGTPGAVRAGRTIVLSLPRGIGMGLLVVGVCVDPDQLMDLAGLVTMIATRSTVTAA